MAAHSAILLMPLLRPSQDKAHMSSYGMLLTDWHCVHGCNMHELALHCLRRSNANNNRMIMHAIIPRSQMALCLDSGEH